MSFLKDRIIDIPLEWSGVDRQVLIGELKVGSTGTVSWTPTVIKALSVALLSIHKGRYSSISKAFQVKLKIQDSALNSPHQKSTYSEHTVLSAIG